MKFLINESLKNKAGVYAIRNLLNDAVYVGATKTFTLRYNSHVSTLRSQTHSDKTLQALVNELGLENFTFDLIQVYIDNSISLRELEQLWLDYFASVNQLLNSTKTSYLIVDNQIDGPTTIGLRLSPELLKKAEARAKELGFKFPEYARYLIANDVKDINMD